LKSIKVSTKKWEYELYYETRWYLTVPISCYFNNILNESRHFVTGQQLLTIFLLYLFFTTGANKSSVIGAYALSVQGIFLKPNSLQALENMIKKIVENWQECIAPSGYDDF
jgi:hypothetical protein